MAKAYYGSKISDNMTKTPEGFLICHNVPIGRTGEYKYLSCEIGQDGNNVISVYRTDDELFDQRTIASFEGKAFTDNHPNEDVTSDNWSMYSKGEISNVRRGKGDFSDCLVADILVRDPVTINEIESGVKREVSSGYDCEYVTKDGKTFQRNIIGNHVSLVNAGRAGHKVAIRDSEMPAFSVSKRNKLNKAILNLL